MHRRSRHNSTSLSLLYFKELDYLIVKVLTGFIVLPLFYTLVFAMFLNFFFPLLLLLLLLLASSS